MDKLHKQIAKGFGHADVSPAAMAYKMLHESRYVNESVLQYAVNYIILMATHPVIPLHLEEVHNQCKVLYTSLQELGLTGTVGRVQEPRNEYLQV
jgi:hypothetical protein